MQRVVAVLLALVAAHGIAATVPFNGCKSDGQTGLLEAPKDRAITLDIDEASAKQLAYYEAANGPHVLGPRGWQCFATYGSNGETLYVTPGPIDAAQLFSSDWKGFSGPAIQMSISIGDTSGRFQVAQIIARVFPDYRKTAEKLIEDMPPAAPLPSGRYPSDRLTFKAKRVVEFETPARNKGLGTDSRLELNDSPVFGMAALVGTTPDCVVLSMRLPEDLLTLRTTILAQAEREAIHQR